jgi:type II secretory pathway pseudopilin PulG
MKLNTRNAKKKAGMTLLELTVVILVLLSLISILFIGARAWKKGSDRAGCIMNIRNIQQAMRGHQNMTNAAATDTIDAETVLIGANGYLTNPPVCPGGGDYTYKTTYGATGVVLTTCDLAATQQHVPTNTSDW